LSSTAARAKRGSTKAGCRESLHLACKTITITTIIIIIIITTTTITTIIIIVIIIIIIYRRSS